jgi:hypothetical protein
MNELDSIIEEICQDVSKETVYADADYAEPLKMLLVVDDATVEKMNCVIFVFKNCVKMFSDYNSSEKIKTHFRIEPEFTFDDYKKIYNIGELFVDFPFVFNGLIDVLHFFYRFMRSLKNYVSRVIIDFKTILMFEQNCCEETLINSQLSLDKLSWHIKHHEMSVNLYQKIIVPIMTGRSLTEMRYYIDDYLGKPFDEYAYDLIIKKHARPGCQYSIKEYHDYEFKDVKIQHRNMLLFDVCKGEQENMTYSSLLSQFKMGKIPLDVRIFGISSHLETGKYENVVVAVFTQPLCGYATVRMVFAKSRKTKPMRRSLEEFSLEEARNLFIKYN